MNKTVVVLSALMILSVGAFAQKGSKTQTPKTIHCAVMTSNTVDVAAATKAHKYADYKGHRYFFCCGGCPEMFKKDPAKYAKNPSIPTPKPAKKSK